MIAWLVVWAQAIVAGPATPQPLFDLTIHLSDVVLFLGFLVAFLKIFITTRDALRDLTKAVGGKNPPEGLVGDVERLSGQVQEHRDALADAGWLNRRIGQADRRPH